MLLLWYVHTKCQVWKFFFKIRQWGRKRWNIIGFVWWLSNILRFQRSSKLEVVIYSNLIVELIVLQCTFLHMHTMHGAKVFEKIWNHIQKLQLLVSFFLHWRKFSRLLKNEEPCKLLVLWLRKKIFKPNEIFFVKLIYSCISQNFVKFHEIFVKYRNKSISQKKIRTIWFTNFPFSCSACAVFILLSFDEK